MRQEVIDVVYQSKIVAIVRGFDPEVCVELADAYAKGGIRLVEVTFPQAKPEDWTKTTTAIKTISECLAGRIIAGAGTVLTLEQLHMAKEAGARYIVTPSVNVNVIKEAKSLGLVTMPGALTPTEAVTAYEAGADFVKIFPAGAMGPKYLKDVRAPLSHIPFLAVGGIGADNVADFMKAGAVGVGVGGMLTDRKLIEAGAWDQIADYARTLYANAHSFQP